jgi:hypothetical protein
MKKNVFISVFVASGLVLFLFIITKPNNKIPYTFGSDSLLVRYNIDALIERAEIIVVGEVRTNLPSLWDGPFGNIDPKKASPEEIAHARGLFTDSLVFVSQTLKGDPKINIVRTRSFIGETENIRWVDESQPSFIVGKTYLLFFAKDIGGTAKINPGDYVTLGGYQGSYEIIDGKAISRNDEWVLEELIAYIQKYLSSEVLVPTLITTPIDLLTETLTALPLPTETPLPTMTPTELLTETPTETPIPTETPTP